jgi:hypothetical protein
VSRAIARLPFPQGGPDVTAIAQIVSRIRIAPIAGILGVAWNLFGIVQFVGTVTATREKLIAGGMTPLQAEVYAGLPVWMDAAFAIGVFGGLAGSVLLVLRHAAAVPVLALSLAAYLVLYAGDIGLGVFAAFGAPQVAILTTVVAIAAALLGVALKARAAG